MDRTIKIRISRYLASCGVSSRRKCERFVLDGKVKVNSKKVTDLSFKVDEKDNVQLDGKTLKCQEKIAIALNKPRGYLSTVKDDFKRKTVIDLIKGNKSRIYPVGRLDYDSRGLIILTNDGKLAYRITHPRYCIPKTYEATIDNEIRNKDINIIKNGIKIDKRKVIPLELKIINKNSKKNKIKIKIVEGRKRVIRKTFKKIGYNVIDLKRTQIGDFKLGSLVEGQFRHLNKNDIKKLLSPNEYFDKKNK